MHFLAKTCSIMYCPNRVKTVKIYLLVSNFVLKKRGFPWTCKYKFERKFRNKYVRSNPTDEGVLKEPDFLPMHCCIAKINSLRYHNFCYETIFYVTQTSLLL